MRCDLAIGKAEVMRLMKLNLIGGCSGAEVAGIMCEAIHWAESSLAGRDV
jgi:hypothetical protein